MGVFDRSLTSLLRSCSNEDLDPLVGYIVSASTNELSIKDAYKASKPKHRAYVDEIVYEVRTFGGNTIANVVRDAGVPYSEVAWDVCDHVGGDPKKGDSVAELELKAVSKILADTLESASPEDRAAMEKELKAAGYTHQDWGAGKPVAMALAQAAFRLGGFASYRLAAIVANAIAKALLGKGLSLGANAVLMRILGVFAGPVGWAVTGLWTAVDIAGPAFRVTMPCVVHIAYLRQKIAQEGK